MVERNGRNIYVIRMWRENGEMYEGFFEADDDHSAIFNADRSFNGRKFRLLANDAEDEMKVLEEISNE